MNIRIIGLGCLALALIAISSGSTQFVAYRLAYHPALGDPLFGTIYNPFAMWEWVFKFGEYARTSFNYAFLAFGIGAIVSILTFRVTVGLKSRSSKKHETTHGTARFATREDVIESGLLPPDPTSIDTLLGKKTVREGVYCGGFDDPATGRTQYLRHYGPEHVAVIAPTGSGKGVTVVIPTLLSWPESLFAFDIKSELAELTSGWRSKYANNVVFRFDPASADNSCKWNPLEEIRFGTRYQVSDSQNVALMLIDDDGKGLAGNHWRTAAYDLIAGAILYCLYKADSIGRPPCILDVAVLLTGKGDFSVITEEQLSARLKALSSLFQEMQDMELPDTIEGKEAKLFIESVGSVMISKPEKELGSIISTANNALSLYRDSVVGVNTSRCDFKVADLMDAEKPVSVYFVATPNQLLRLRPLVRLLLTRIVLGLTGEMKFVDGRSVSPHKHELLLMLDEFPSLGNLEVFESALAFMRSYGIKAYIIAQNIGQITKAYTANENIIANCHIRVAYAPNKIETAKWLSDMAGETTIVTEHISNSGKRFGLVAEQYSSSFQSTRRALITPQEVMDLDKTRVVDGKVIPGKMLVYAAGSPVIMGRQTPYYLDPVFNARSKIPPHDERTAVREKGYGFAIS